MLRVPLDADAERMGRKLQPLRKSVFAYGGNGKAGAFFIHRLMMQAVDNGGRFFEDFFKSGMGTEADLMASSVL